MAKDADGAKRAKVGDVFRVIGGDEITCKLTGDETGGQFAVFETTSPAGAGPPPHVHHREDETFYVVAGQFEFYSQGQTIALRPGEVFHAPRDVPHRFANVGATPGKLVIVVHPAGIEHFFAELAEIPTPADGPPDVARLTALGARFGLEFLF